MSQGQLKKLTIRTVEGPPIEVECLFNPKEYQIQRSNSWGEVDNASRDTPHMSFTGSSGSKLSLQLFFDTYLQRKSATSDPQDVRDFTNPLWKMMNINRKELYEAKSQRGRPPVVQFFWGRTWSFKAVITSMQQQYTMFTSAGIPVRAMVTIEFLEAEEIRTLVNNASNPSSENRDYAINAGKSPGANEENRPKSN